MPSYFVEVAAPQARAQTSANLLASAPPDNSGDDAWMNGLSFLGEMCPQFQVFDPCGEPADSPASATDVTFLSPLGYRLWTECSTNDVDLTTARDRLARQAAAVASYAMARELWEGAGTAADPFTDPYGNANQHNPYFTDGSAEVVTGAVDHLHALGLLEQAARDKTKGMQVFLHIPIAIATQVAAQLFKVGNEIRTATDAIVIADAGYSGKGPAAQIGTWGYATGPVSTKLGPVNLTDLPVYTVDRQTNRRTVWADRMFAAGYDPCASVAIQFPEP